MPTLLPTNVDSCVCNRNKYQHVLNMLPKFSSNIPGEWTCSFLATMLEMLNCIKLISCSYASHAIYLDSIMAACFTRSFERTSALVDLYENATYLWDVRCEEYHNKFRRNSAIQEIANHFGTAGQLIFI